MAYWRWEGEPFQARNFEGGLAEEGNLIGIPIHHLIIITLGCETPLHSSLDTSRLS